MSIVRNLANLPGWRTNRKIVVIEDKSYLYDTLDSLEKKEDLEAFLKKHTNNKLNDKEHCQKFS